MANGNEAGNLDKALTADAAAEFLATTRKTLESWRHWGRGPTYLKQGRSVRYRMRDLLKFQERNVVHTGEGNDAA